MNGSFRVSQWNSVRCAFGRWLRLGHSLLIEADFSADPVQLFAILTFKNYLQLICHKYKPSKIPTHGLINPELEFEMGNIKSICESYSPFSCSSELKVIEINDQTKIALPVHMVPDFTSTLQQLFFMNMNFFFGKQRKIKLFYQFCLNEEPRH